MAQKEKRNFEKLAELFSEESNRTNLRQFLTNAKNDCIPYLGIFFHMNFEIFLIWFR